jgi:hypothetical protein
MIATTREKTHPPARRPNTAAAINTAADANRAGISNPAGADG